MVGVQFEFVLQMANSSIPQRNNDASFGQSEYPSILQSIAQWGHATLLVRGVEPKG